MQSFMHVDQRGKTPLMGVLLGVLGGLKNRIWAADQHCSI